LKNKIPRLSFFNNSYYLKKIYLEIQQAPRGVMLETERENYVLSNRPLYELGSDKKMSPPSLFKLYNTTNE
jgi:hypothetical protein